MSSHRVDPLSLFGGVLFLSFGVVGLLHSAGWIDRGAPVWAAVAAVAGLGALGVGLSLRAALASTDPQVDEPVLDAEIDTEEGVVSM